MGWKIAPVLAVMALFLLLAFPQQVSALPTCSNDTVFELSGSSPKEMGKDFSVLFYTTISPPNPWGFYTNASLDFSDLNLISGSQFVNLTTSNSTVNWVLNGTTLGSKLLNLTVQNSTGDACEKTISLTVAEATDPILNLTTDNVTEVPANKPFSYTVNLTNTGNENATSIVIVVSNPEISSTKNITVLTNDSSITQTFNLTQLTCKSFALTTSVTYSDTSTPTSANYPKTIISSDEYVANSSDLLLNTFSLSSSSVTEGATITFSTEVKNIAERNSTGFNVSFYKNSVSDSNKLVTASSSDSLGYLQSRNVSTTWTAAGTATASIVAVVDAFDGDCDLNNTQKTSSLTINAATGNSNQGGGNNPSTSPSINTACTYNWECGDWSVCSSESKQARSCLNKGTCTGVEGKPEESQSCVFVPVQVEESKRLDKIEKGSTQTVTFEKDVAIQEISITAKDAIEGATLKVKTLPSKPVNIEPNITGTVYKYIEISHENIEGKIGKATIKFKVEKAWLGANKIDKNKVVLNRYTGKWDKLNTKLLSEDNLTAVYEADTPGFSIFAISGEELKADDAQSIEGGPTGLVIGGSTLAGIVIVVVAAIAIAILFISGKRNKNMDIKVKKQRKEQ